MGDWNRFWLGFAGACALAGAVITIVPTPTAPPTPTGLHIVRASTPTPAYTIERRVDDSILIRIPDEFCTGTDMANLEAAKFVWRELQMRGAVWGVIVNDGWVPMRRRIHVEEVEELIELYGDPEPLEADEEENDNAEGDDGYGYGHQDR